MVENKFELYSSEMLQNEEFSLISQRFLSPWLKKVSSFTAVKYSRMKDLHWWLGNTFTMVEENFEIYCSEILQNDYILRKTAENWN